MYDFAMAGLGISFFILAALYVLACAHL